MHKNSYNTRTSSGRGQHTPVLRVVRVEARLPALCRALPLHNGDSDRLERHGILVVGGTWQHVGATLTVL